MAAAPRTVRLMDPQDALTLAAVLLFGLAFTAFWLGVFWFGRMVKRLEATVDRMERETERVAEKRQGIAEDLADAGQRAANTDGAPGAAADAALTAVVPHAGDKT